MVAERLAQELFASFNFRAKNLIRTFHNIAIFELKRTIRRLSNSTPESWRFLEEIKLIFAFKFWIIFYLHSRILYSNLEILNWKTLQ